MKEETNNPIVIFGSSNNRGNTWKAIQTVLEKRDVPIVEFLHNFIKVQNCGFQLSN